MKNFLSLLSISLMLLYNSSVHSQIISTFAGNHEVGDRGPATAANIVFNSGIGQDPSGNIFVAESPNITHCRIRKINTSGIITTIAGDTTFGYSGDGGPATAAQFYFDITSLCVDPAGNVYISDGANYRVRKVSPAGIVTTICGTGTSSFSGDGGPATAATNSGNVYLAADAAGNIYVSDNGDNRVRKINTSGIITTIAGNGSYSYSGDGGPATAAGVSSPYGVTVDAAGNVVFIDGSSRIRKVNTSGIITTVAGNGTAGYSGDGGPATAASTQPTYGDVFFDPAGNMYICEPYNSRIRKVNTSGIITTFAGNGTAGYSGDGGPATAAMISLPYFGFADAAGNIYISDKGNSRIRKIDAAGIITTYAGDGTGGFTGDGGQATSARLFIPEKVNVDKKGNVYVTDFGNTRIRKVNASGIITTIAGNGVAGYSGDGGPATAASFSFLEGVAADGSGNVYICDGDNFRVRKVDVSGIVTTFAGNGTFGYSGDGGQATAASINSPNGIAIDNAGNVYIADFLVVRKVSTSGIITTIAGNGTTGYSGDGGQATAAALNGPSAIAIDKAGNLYIADIYNFVIRKVSTTGIITTIAGDGTMGYGGDGGPATAAQLNYPEVVDVDKRGNVYICDNNNFVIRKVDTLGIITTYTGTGTGGYYGDGGPATNAMLFYPDGLAVDTEGRVFISDCWNNVIRVTKPHDIAPHFTNAPSQSLVLCTDGIPTLLDPLLAINDPDTGQIETWSLALAPLHGSASISFNINNTGTVLIPLGLYYVPVPGYIGQDSFKVKISDGQLSDTITIYITNLPVPHPKISSNSPICVGDSLKLFENGTVTGRNYSWSGPALFTSMLLDPVIYNAAITNAGTYTFTVSDSVCVYSVSTDVVIYPKVVLTDVTPDCTIPLGTTVQLNALGATMYYWTPNDGSLSNPNINNPVATPMQPTVYTVVGMNIVGCRDTAFVHIDISYTDVHIPDAFTPNGDGLNDIFRIGNARGFKLVDFRVYDRWGEEVYQNTTNINEGWNGTYKGVPMDMNTYYYMIIVAAPDGKEKMFKGNVTLIR